MPPGGNPRFRPTGSVRGRRAPSGPGTGAREAGGFRPPRRLQTRWGTSSSARGGGSRGRTFFFLIGLVSHETLVGCFPFTSPSR